MGYCDKQKSLITLDDLNIPAETIATIKAKATGNRISCVEARALAADLGLELGALGQIMDCLGIKVNHCQLGCF